MTIAIILLVLVAALYICRNRIKKAIKRQIRKAEDALADLIIRGIKALGRASWTLITEAFYRMVSLA